MPSCEGPTVLAAGCCIVGGGPAGMMLGLLLARAGVDVVVLEKHSDFLRDFRGDMIHPSTLELMHELDILEELLALPHQQVHSFVAQIGQQRLPLVDFAALPTRCRFLAYMPQWEFLDFLRAHAARYPKFHLRMGSEVVGLMRSDAQVTGVRVKGPDGLLAVRADLTVCADGRSSQTREWAGLDVDEVGTPIDVLWMRISRRAEDGESLRRIAAGQIFVTIDRGDYWQCALVIPKGSFSKIRQQGLSAFRDRIVKLAPSFHDRADELASWDDVKPLTVTINRLRQWHRPGLLCVGDAAHAMSPVIGVGVNLAIQDAVAAANIVSGPLRDGTLSVRHLQQVQKRREFPVRLMHWFQTLVERQIVKPVLASRETPSVPWILRLPDRSPAFRRVLGHVIGLGFRREHVQTPDVLRMSGNLT
jgi:2-polyprenyl-6-methoxyphenol hydroxylase-like FAD-dependent oxidoreductase